MSSADPKPDPTDNLPETAELFDTTIESLCEFGDITLVVEDGFHPELRVTVSSCILASTSKVFKALFKGCFAEGEAIRSGQRDIYIADKPAAMLALCQLLHFKPGSRRSHATTFSTLHFSSINMTAWKRLSLRQTAFSPD